MLLLLLLFLLYFLDPQRQKKIEKNDKENQKGLDNVTKSFRLFSNKIINSPKSTTSCTRSRVVSAPSCFLLAIQSQDYHYRSLEFEIVSFRYLCMLLS